MLKERQKSVPPTGNQSWDRAESSASWTLLLTRCCSVRHVGSLHLPEKQTLRQANAILDSICQGPGKVTVCHQQEAEPVVGMRGVLELGPEMFKASMFDYGGQMGACVQRRGQTVQSSSLVCCVSVLVKLGDG